MNLNIRPYVETDAPRCCEIILACLPQLDGLNDAARAFLRDKLVPERLHAELGASETFVAEDSSGVEGLVALQGQEAKRLYVHPSAQGRGIGRRLFDHIEQLGRLRGLRELIGEAPPAAAPFYESLGFEVTGSDEIQRGEAIFRMLKIRKQLVARPGSG